MDGYSNLISLWQNNPFISPPYILSEDKEIIQKSQIDSYSSYEEYVQNEKLFDQDDTHIHFGLLPVPYIGNLERASIFLLALNPSVSGIDYAAERNPTSFFDAQVRNIHQKNIDDEFPFFCLNPEFAWTSGFDYWIGKFNSIMNELAINLKISKQKALKIIAQNVACLELFPYRSAKFGSSNLLDQLVSVQMIRNYVNQVLIPRAEIGEITLIVLRGQWGWSIPNCENGAVLISKTPRSSSLNISLPEGREIFRRLQSVLEKQI